MIVVPTVDLRAAYAHLVWCRRRRDHVWEITGHGWSSIDYRCVLCHKTRMRWTD